MKYKVAIEGQTFEVEIEDVYARPVVAVVDGERVEVWPDNGQSSRPAISPGTAPVRAAAPLPRHAEPAVSSGAAVRAPIPGVVVGISVEAGARVERGQELLVIEAMKMKNAVRATRAGTVKVIHATVGQQVKQRDLLLEFED
ncbi:MAG: biotin/lipoyl-binding protein [Anaerolineae bacterium]|nr:biotin/lipoyl-binding protein [Anaerolineae bacterium]